MYETPDEFRNAFVTQFVAFMKECNFHYEKSRSFSSIYAGIAYCYRPSIRYWERLTLAHVAEALEAYLPTRTNEPVHDLDQFLFRCKRIEEHLYMRRHDERNALMLAALPVEARPKCAEKAAHWICLQLKRMGDQESLEYAERDGAKCGEAALIHLEVLEAATTDNPVLDPHAEDAYELLAQATISSARFAKYKAKEVPAFVFE